MLGTGPSIQLLRVFGIRIGASPSWFIVLFVFIYLGSDYFRDVLGGSVTEAYLVAVAAVFLFFVSLVMHELGHALVARREGIEISGIDLWFFGGVAKMARDTQSPGAEFKIAAAGPLVTLVLVGIFFGLSALVQNGAALDVVRLAGDAEVSPTLALLGFLATINLMLLVFNLVPAFPLDGGRIARAVVWRITGDRNRATRVAGRLGEGFAYILIGVGVFLAARGDALQRPLARGARLVHRAVRARRRRVDGVHRAHRRHHRRGHHGRPAGLDARPHAGRPGPGRVLPALPLGLVSGRRRATGRFVGVVREPRIDQEIAAGRPALEVGELVETREADSWRVRSDSPLEALLGDEGLRTNGALMAVDADGVLRGVVTMDQVRRALTAALPQRLA